MCRNDDGRKPGEAGTSAEGLIRVVSPEVIAKKLREDLRAAGDEIQRIFNLEKKSRENVQKLLEEIEKLRKQ